MTNKRLAYLGPAGTFSEEAAHLYLAGAGARLLPFQSIPAVVEAVEKGLADEGIIPVENSLEGSVSVTLDILVHESTLSISHELVMPIRSFLLAKPGTDVTEIRVLFSHPQPLGQCRRFIDRCLPKVEVVAALSTSASVDEMMNYSGAPAAAIAPRRAAEIYDAAVLASDIQDQASNQTRFIVLSRADHEPTGDDKTSLCFDLRSNVPGTLVGALQEFASAGINLDKVESRPTKEALGEYFFLVDLRGHRLDPAVARALDRVKAMSAMFKVFGSYPRHRA